MDNTENKMGPFKSSVFGGFNKEDVLYYLDKTDVRHQEQLDDLKNRFLEINEERNYYANAFQSQQKELDALSSRLQVLADSIDSQNKEIRLRQIDLEKKTLELQELRKENHGLSTQLDVQSRKSRHFERLQGEAEKVLQDTKRRSDQFLTDLEKKNRILLAQTREETQIVDNTFQSLYSHLETFREQLKTAFHQMEDQLSQLEDELFIIAEDFSIPQKDGSDPISIEEYMEEQAKEKERILRSQITQGQAQLKEDLDALQSALPTTQPIPVAVAATGDGSLDVSSSPQQEDFFLASGLKKTPPKTEKKLDPFILPIQDQFFGL